MAQVVAQVVAQVAQVSGVSLSILTTIFLLTWSTSLPSILG